MSGYCSASNRLIIICGLSFAGKSVLAEAICSRFKYLQVDVNEVKTGLFGVDVRDEDLSKKQWDLVYGEADNMIVNYLQLDAGVVDASRHFRKAERSRIKRIAHGIGVKTITVHVNTPEAEARRRWMENRVNPTRRDIAGKHFEEIVKAMEPPDANEDAIVFHWEDDIGDWLSKHADILAGG